MPLDLTPLTNAVQRLDEGWRVILQIRQTLKFEMALFSASNSLMNFHIKCLSVFWNKVLRTLLNTMQLIFSTLSVPVMNRGCF